MEDAVRTRLRVRSDVDYQVARTNEEWPDHVLRTLTTAAHIAWLRPNSILDPACGDGTVVKAALKLWSAERVLFSDIGRENIKALRREGWETDQDDALELLRSQADKSWDVIVLTEFLEHIADPDELLREAKRVGSWLVASSPEMRVNQVDSNPEHLWMFDGDGFREMLAESGWIPTQKSFLGFPALMYDFQIWVCTE
jgi:2-polyprenyl-3-methyl-5-hydroxy-6-metoxy-1,4-benzoquinol methylase